MDPSLGKRENVLFSLCSSLGPIVKWYYAAFALPRRESDSPWVHKFVLRGCRGGSPILHGSTNKKHGGRLQCFLFVRTQLFDINNLILLRAFRRIKGEYLILLLVHQGRAKGRKMRNLVLLHVRLRGTDNFICVLLFLALFLDCNDASKRYGVPFRLLNYARARQAFFYPADSVLGCRLQVAGFLIFGVLRKISEGTRVFQLFGNLAAAHSLQVLKLFRQLVKLFFAQIICLVIHHKLCAVLYSLRLQEQAQQYVERSS